MSAAVAHHQPEQLGFLPPVEEPHHQGAGADVLAVAVGGPVKHAEVRISTDGRPHLTVAILQPKDALPFVATYHGDTPNLWHLRAMEQRLLRPGALALLRGEGLQLKPYAGAPALHLVRCTAVAELDVADVPTTLATEALNARL